MKNHEDFLERIAAKVEHIAGKVEGLAGFAQVAIAAFPDLERFDEGLTAIEEALPSLRANGMGGQETNENFLMGLEGLIRRVRAVLEEARAAQNIGKPPRRKRP